MKKTSREKHSPAPRVNFSLCSLLQHLQEPPAEDGVCVWEAELVQQPLYRWYRCTDQSCKACRWSSKCLSNIHQARRGSAAGKRGRKRRAPTPPTAVTVASPQPNSSSQTHLHLLSTEPGGHFVTEAIIIKRHNFAYKYPVSFTFTYEADAAQTAGVSACECVHVGAPGHTGYSSPSVVGSVGRTCHLSLPWQRPASHPGWSGTLQPPFTVRARLLMRPGECQSKMEAVTCMHQPHTQWHSIWIQVTIGMVWFPSFNCYF